MLSRFRPRVMIEGFVERVQDGPKLQPSDLPRTNNDLEHLFGSHRYHERRARAVDGVPRRVWW